MSDGNQAGNSFAQPHPQVTPTSMPIVQQIQQSSTSMPTLSPATIVRPVIASSDHQQQSRLPSQHQQFTNVAPAHQVRHQTPSSETAESPIIVPAPFQPQPAPASSVGGPKTKGQSKQPRQPKNSKKSPRQQSDQQPKTVHYASANIRMTKKQQEKEDYYNRKYQLLRKCIRSLVFKNAALCDEVARLHQRIATVDDERKTLVKRLLHHERLKVRRKQISENKKAQQEAAAAAAAATASIATPLATTAVHPLLSPVATSGVEFHRDTELG